MKKYDSYKDSGVEWIGEIPSGWEINRLKWISLIENSGIWGEDEEFPNSINVPIPTTGQLSIEGEWYYDKMNLRHLSIEDWEKYKCIEGDIIVVKSSGSSTNIITGKCGFISKEDSEKFSFSNFLLRVRPDKITPKLVYYFLSSNLTKQRIERMVSSTTYPNLKVDEYSNSELLIPPLSEQQQIVSFLDTKTSLIDSLIEKTQRKIELFKEKRTSLINEVVTKGLNPNVEMKDSGVEWIGEIPIHWVSSPLKRLVKIGNGKDYKHIEVENGGYPVYGTGGVFSRCSEYLHTGPSVLLGRKGTIDNPLFVNEPFWTSDTIYFTIIDESKILPSLLFRLVHQIPFDLFSYGSTIPSMTKSDYEEMKFPLPPLQEQTEIVSYLDEQIKLMDKTISIEEKRIELLKEYRQSLISEVVTGKLKVVE